MANSWQLRRLKCGVRGWNAWRKRKGARVEIDLSRANLVGANLGNAHLSHASFFEADLRGADLSGANFSGAQLRDANLEGANLNLANLVGARLSDADLNDADLVGADLSGADLSDADLGGANLIGANLSGAEVNGAHLNGANLRNANLTGASLLAADLVIANLLGASLRNTDLSDARLAMTSLGSLDLSRALGLAEVNHIHPSQVSIDTLERTAQGLATAPPERRGEVETFLRGAGAPEYYIEMFRSRIDMPIEFYSAFISYSHADKVFARRLYNDLQAQGIRCWLDEKDAILGDRILHVVNQAIRSTDRVLLCCSLASLTSLWVDRELAIAFEKEQGGEEDILIPLDLDGYLFDGWDGRGRGPIVRERVAGNFVGWKQDADLYARELERVVEAMRPRGDRDGE